MKQAQKFLRRFCSDTDGSVAVELVLVVPMLVWALLSTFVYFDAYRMESVNTRAGLTLADMISREQVPVSENYIDAMQGLLSVLAFSDSDPGLRVTVFRYDAPADAYQTIWSRHRSMPDALDDVDLLDLRNRLPLMADNSRAILVETNADYRARMKMGIGPFQDTNLDDVAFRSFTVISPRFLGTICFDPTPADPSSGDEQC